MRKADNLPPYRAVVMKSGSLNFLEPSGPPQACYGRTLPFTPCQILLGWSNQGGQEGWGIVKKCTQHLGGVNLKEGNGTEDLGIDVCIILKWILQKDHVGLI